MKRALFLPNYFGSGFGHVGRCLALADGLSARNWKVALVLSGPHGDRTEKAGYRVFKPWFPTRPRFTQADAPAYTYILDGNIQALRDGFVRPWKFYAAVMETTRFVKQFRPDVLIGDFSLLTWVLGKKLGVPVVQIAQSISHPADPRIIWWETPPHGMVSPNIGPVFNSFLRRWNLGPVSRVEQLIEGDMFLIPSIPELEHIPESFRDTYYLGPLFHEKDPQPNAHQLIAAQQGRPLVYVTIGGGSVGNLQFFELLNSAFASLPLSVIVSTGRRFDPSKLPPPPSNISYYQWVDGPAAMKRSNVVVFHGGHGTMMETVYYGVPSVVVPFHSEQEGNGRRLQGCSAGLVLGPTSGDGSLRLIRRRWAYGEYSTWIQPETRLTPESLRKATLSVLEDPRFSSAATTLAHTAKNYGGASLAADLITRLLDRHTIVQPGRDNR